MVLPERKEETYPGNRDARNLPQLRFSQRDAFGRPVGDSRLAITAQRYNIRSEERSAIIFETRIRRLASQREIPATIVSRAIHLSRRMNRKHGKLVLEDWALALLLAACREAKFISTIDDLIRPNGNKLQASNVRRYYNLLKRAMGLKISPPDVKEYIVYFAGKLGLGIQVVMKAIVVSARRGFNDTAHCVAAGALYVAAKETGVNISQKAFCRKTGISEITLRNWATKLGGYRFGRTRLPEPRAEDLIT